MKRIIYRKDYKIPVAWGYEEKHNTGGYIEFALHFDYKRWLLFSVTVPNKSFCSRNPFKCFYLALESENFGMMKYNRLKELIRKQDMWRKLNPYIWEEYKKSKEEK